MNIFLSSPDPRECAQALDDKRVVKMALETAQLLATVCHSLGHNVGYKPTHGGHPCTVWAGKSRERFAWLVEHGLELCEEYRFRYRPDHKSKEIIELAAKHRHDLPSDALLFDFNSSGFNTGDVFFDYQCCLVNKWRHKDVRKPTWTYRGRPPFARQLWDSNFNTISKEN
jgi:hypothetical protein